MKLIDAYRTLASFAQPLLQSTDVSALLQIPRGHASKLMTRLSESGFTVPLVRGRWAINRDVDPLLVPEFLTAPSPSYISLQSALFHHGMISQVPDIIYAVSISRARLFKTALGSISIHHLEPELFFGFQSLGREGIKMATPEKALVDFLYLSPGRSKLFHTLPEVELPRAFSAKRAFEITSRIDSKSRRTIVREGLERILGRAV